LSRRHQTNQEDLWSWIKSEKGTYLQSENLNQKGIKHGFFTKGWEGKSPKELIKSIGLELSIHYTKQIHSDYVIEASKASNPPWPAADGLVSDQKGQSLWVYSADCIPVLFADPINGLVAASHAGWRGLAKGILLKTIQKLESFGAKRNKLIITLGPAISRAHYQVNLQTADSIYESIYRKTERMAIGTEEKIQRMIRLGLVHKDINPEKVNLDIRLSAALQLYIAGLRYEQISISPFCTFSNQEIFNSWRRDKSKKRQWSFISS